jgi:putative transposase
VGCPSATHHFIRHSGANQLPDYRRNRTPGGTYFFTVNLLDRTSSLLTDHIDTLRQSVRRARELKPFHIDAWVVLPDHMHAIWTLPEGDTDFPTRWQTIKAAFSRRIPPTEPRSPSRQAKAERGIWQRRYWEHTIRNEQDYTAHLDYIHFNPVKHGLAPTPSAWPFTSFHTHVTNGLYPPDWTIPNPPQPATPSDP